MLTRIAIATALLAVSLTAQQGEYAVEAELSERPVDKVLARVDAALDDWIGEQDFEAINVKLKELGGRLKSGEGSFEPLGPQLSRFRKLALAELKIISSKRSERQSTVAEIDLRVGRRRGSRRPAAVVPRPATMRWERVEGEWTPVSTTIGALRRSGRINRTYRDHRPSLRRHRLIPQAACPRRG